MYTVLQTVFVQCTMYVTSQQYYTCTCTVHVVLTHFVWYFIVFLQEHVQLTDTYSDVTICELIGYIEP